MADTDNKTGEAAGDLVPKSPQVSSVQVASAILNTPPGTFTRSSDQPIVPMVDKPEQYAKELAKAKLTEKTKDVSGLPLTASELKKRQQQRIDELRQKTSTSVIDDQMMTAALEKNRQIQEQLASSKSQNFLNLSDKITEVVDLEMEKSSSSVDTSVFKLPLNQILLSSESRQRSNSAGGAVGEKELDSSFQADSGLTVKGMISYLQKTITHLNSIKNQLPIARNLRDIATGVLMALKELKNQDNLIRANVADDIKKFFGELDNEVDKRFQRVYAQVSEVQESSQLELTGAVALLEDGNKILSDVILSSISRVDQDVNKSYQLSMGASDSVAMLIARMDRLENQSSQMQQENKQLRDEVNNLKYQLHTATDKNITAEKRLLSILLGIQTSLKKVGIEIVFDGVDCSVDWSKVINDTQQQQQSQTVFKKPEPQNTDNLQDRESVLRSLMAESGIQPTGLPRTPPPFGNNQLRPNQFFTPINNQVTCHQVKQGGVNQFGLGDLNQKRRFYAYEKGLPVDFKNAGLKSIKITSSREECLVWLQRLEAFILRAAWPEFAILAELGQYFSDQMESDWFYSNSQRFKDLATFKELFCKMFACSQRSRTEIIAETMKLRQTSSMSCRMLYLTIESQLKYCSPSITKEELIHIFYGALGTKWQEYYPDVNKVLRMNTEEFLDELEKLEEVSIRKIAESIADNGKYHRQIDAQEPGMCYYLDRAEKQASAKGVAKSKEIVNKIKSTPGSPTYAEVAASKKQLPVKSNTDVNTMAEAVVLALHKTYPNQSQQSQPKKQNQDKRKANVNQSPKQVQFSGQGAKAKLTCPVCGGAHTVFSCFHPNAPRDAIEQARELSRQRDMILKAAVPNYESFQERQARVHANRNNNNQGNGQSVDFIAAETTDHKQ